MNFLKKIAPSLSTALSFGGPVGAIAGKAISAALGATVDVSNPQDLAAAVAGATPEQVAAIQQAEQQFQVQMKQLDIQSVDDLVKMHNEDVANARDREVQLARAGAKDMTPKIMGTGVIAGFMVALFMVLGGHAKVDSVLSGTLIGYISAKAELVLSYYFGSSAGSDRKTELMATAAK